MQYILYILLFFPLIIQSQEIQIQILPKEINTKGAEFNFIQIDEKNAYYSSATLEKENYQSAIYKTSYKNEKWSKGRYFMLGNFYNTANIQFHPQEKDYYFTASENQGESKIYCVEKISGKTRLIPYPINIKNTNNTQPHIAYHSHYRAMYFVSDRDGGFGGMDIWISIIDDKGNFGVPINAGSKINSRNDEITPYYNSWSNEMYFSSNRKKEASGFDIYIAKGQLNFWSQSVSFDKLNTDKDEMYLTFFNDSSGYFSSNRADSGCCNNIYSFRYKQNFRESKQQKTITNYLPLTLYFHNDEPDCRTMNTTTDKTYKEAYISYFQMEEEYITFSKDTLVKSFFKEKLKANFNKLLLILDKILIELNSGKKIELQIQGYASVLYDEEYNINLSKRRIASFSNFLKSYKSKIFKQYLNKEQLIISVMPFGESQSLERSKTSFQSKKHSIYGIDAMLERRIEIINIISH